MGKSKILVVDDTPDLLDLYSTILRGDGYEVSSASSGQQCLKLVSESKPHLVLLDVMLPDISGIDVCRQIKANPETASVLVLNISGRLISGNSQAEGLDAGADGYLTKPFEDKALLAHVRALLRMRKAEEQMRRSEEQFRAAFDNALDAMLISDDSERFIDANPAACIMFGVSKEKLLTGKLSDFVESSEQTRIKLLWQELLKQGEQEGSFRLCGPDGSTREVEFRGKARFLPHRHLTVLRDVTEKKRAAESLIEAHEELEKRVQQRTAELRGANAFLKKEIASREAADEALKQAEAKYRGIFENAMEGIFQSTPEGRFIAANPAMARIFGYDSPEELIHDREDIEKQHYVEPSRRGVFKSIMAKHDSAFQFEIEAYRKDGTKIWTSENVRTVRDDDGNLLYYQGIVHDITDQKRSEELRQLLSSIVRSSSDGIVSLSIDGKFTSWNAGAEKMFGYSEAEVLGQDISMFLPPDVSRDSIPLHHLVSTGKSVSFEGVRLRKDGTPIDVSIINSAIKNEKGEVVGVSGIVRDISDRKRADQMRNQLLQRLVMTQEDERRRLSRELHDQMGQSLAALMLGLKSLADSGGVTPAGTERLQQLQGLTNQLAEEAHSLARDLRPTALDDLGLHTALANYVEEWSERSTVPADFHSNGLLKQRLPPHIETAIYRIVQEALTNVLKHAVPTNVSVIVENRDNRVLTIVEDNGCGFDVEAVMKAPVRERRLGLLGMQERVVLLGGSFTVESTPNVGTMVLATIPLEV